MAELTDYLRHFARSGIGLPHIGMALAILAAAFLLARLFRKSLESVRRRAPIGSPSLYIVEQLGGYAIIVVGVILVVSTLGLDLTSLTVFGGALGVGLGLGLQGIVKEFVSGIALIFDRNLKVGDFVELSDGIRGEIVEIGPRATRLRTNDDFNVVIPNSKFFQSQVANWTYNDASRRMHVPFSVDSDADVALVRRVAIDAAKALPFTLPDDDLRRTQVWLTSFSGEGLCFDLVVWPAPGPSRHPSTMHAAYTWAVYQALRTAGVDDANTQVDINLRSAFGQAGEKATELFRPTVAGPRRADTSEAAAPNDAVGALYEDAARNARHREQEARERGARAASEGRQRAGDA